MSNLGTSQRNRPDELVFLPLGGAGEIGMNLTLYGYGGEWLMVDCGVTFADDSMPGLDVIMPDPGFIADRCDRLAGLVVTHGHEDHIGAIPYLWTRFRCPVYATPFARALLYEKLVEAGLQHEIPITEVPLSGKFTVGPFEIELITLTHSIPEPNAVVIRTPLGTILHTGDWKLDPSPLVGDISDEAALRRLGEEGVLAMVCDSTNALRPGHSGSEATVRESLVDLVGRYDRRVAVACFASNVARLESIAAAAVANNREVALVGRSLWRIYKAARDTGYLRNTPPFLSEDEAAAVPRDRILLVCTGSQGEPRAALSRIAQGDHPHVSLDSDDAVIFSSRIIPGNERAIGRLQNKLAKAGVVIVTEHDHFVHVSGHPAQDELAQMYQMVRPRIAVPVHGEVRHLMAHAQLARDCQVAETVIAENGAMVRLAPGPAEIIDTVAVGRLVVDGNQLRALGSAALKSRQRMGFNGTAVATVVLDRNGSLLATPQVTVQGLVEEADAATLGALGERLGQAIAELPASRRRDDEAVREAARLAMRRSLKASYGKKPVTDIHIVRL
ncbi:MAG TPA: ribonuclease J [Stellaceae bacterium]|nr:ribonuclease J [Stellaceae bacterium]